MRSGRGPGATGGGECHLVLLSSLNTMLRFAGTRAALAAIRAASIPNAVALYAAYQSAFQKMIHAGTNTMNGAVTATSAAIKYR